MSIGSLSYSINSMSSIVRSEEIMKLANPLSGTKLSVIAENNGISINIANMQKITPKVIGAIFLRDKDKSEDNNNFLLFVEESLTKDEQRFTIAKCLGYFFLYRDVLNSKMRMVTRDDETRDKYGIDPIQEQEVHLFAEELLMPKDLVERAWKTTKEIDKLSEIFALPIDIIARRLRYLGIVK